MCYIIVQLHYERCSIRRLQILAKTYQTFIWYFWNDKAPLYCRIKIIETYKIACDTGIMRLSIHVIVYLSISMAYILQISETFFFLLQNTIAMLGWRTLKLALNLNSKHIYRQKATKRTINDIFQSLIITIFDSIVAIYPFKFWIKKHLRNFFISTSAYVCFETMWSRIAEGNKVYSSHDKTVCVYRSYLNTDRSRKVFPELSFVNQTCTILHFI